MANNITPKTYIYGIIIMMFFIVGGMSLMSQFVSFDDHLDNTSELYRFNQTFDKLSTVSEKVDGIESNFESDPDWGLFGGLNALIKSSWNTFSLMISSWGFMGDVFGGLTSIFGVPSWIISIIGLLISVTIAFAVYSLIFQRDA